MTPSFGVVYELPRPIQTSQQDLPEREYPSVACSNADILLVSDGHGSLHTLRLQESDPAILLNSYELSIPEAYESAKQNVPFHLHFSVSDPSSSALAVLSSKHYPKEVPDKPTKGSISKVKFDVWGVKLNLNLPTQEQPLPLDIIWHRRGEDVPQFLAHDASRQAVMILGSCPYTRIDSPSTPAYEPTSDEFAPIPRAGENLNNPSPELGIKPPPPYSWTQSSDSVTVAFPLPSSTPKQAIKVTFSPRTLTVLVAAESPSPSVPIPKYTAKVLWDGIQPSSSFWTWDKDDNRSFGVLTLHLDKQHEDTRWVQLFAASGQKPSGFSTEPDEMEVPETLDPSELYNIRESMEKFTEALQSGEKGGIPSLAEGEMDEEIDSQMDKWSFMTWVGEDGQEPSWANNLGMDAPISVLSTPLPGYPTVSPSLIVKNGLDGAVFALQNGSSPSDPPTWKHTSTFSVLSFVLASKRDTRFVYHARTRAVLAFESGTQGNVYVYRNITKLHDQSAKQAVLKIASGVAGALLGVGAVTHIFTSPEGQKQKHRLLLELCEGELVVAHNVL